MKLHACIIAKNEEAMIERCLKSLGGVDEIVVVDTGSTDNTVKIAKKYATVYTDYEWSDDFAEARNHALSKSTGDFNICIDADEYLPKGMISKIKAELETIGDYTGLNVKLQWDDTHSHTVPRIIKKGVTYTGSIHEYATCHAKPSDLWWTYEKSPSHDVDPDRNLRMLLADKTNPRSMFYLAHEYQDRLNWEGAIVWYNKYLELGTWRYEKADAHLSKARCLWNVARGEMARQACLQAILLNPNFKEAYLLMAEMSWEKERVVWGRLATVATNEDVLFIR